MQFLDTVNNSKLILEKHNAVAKFVLHFVTVLRIVDLDAISEEGIKIG